MALLPSDPKQRNALFIGILFAAGFYFFWTYWYGPRKTETDEMEARLEQLDAENRRAQIVATRGGAELEERLALYERHVGRLEQLIPKSEEVPALVNDITAEARRSGVEVARIFPEPEETGPFYTKKSYEIDVYGEYHDIGRWLASIASLPRIITPVDLEMGRFQGDASVVDFEAPVTARLRIQTYILPGEGESAPPADAGVVEGGVL
jgi:type IV pilus assembly protein PilO